MFLRADAIRLGQPRAKVFVDVVDARQSENVDVVARRDGLNAAKARMLETSREHNVPVEPRTPRCYLRERHAHLKCDPGFLRKYSHRPDLFDRSDDRIE